MPSREPPPARRPAGLMSGLTLGLFSLSPMELQVLLDSGDRTQRAQAARIMPVRIFLRTRLRSVVSE